jgi:pyruvate formate lyase activating enzyme
MADLKIWDSDLHLKYTGVRNEQIKENFKRLNELGIPIIARTPIIPEIEQGVEEISAFLLDMENVIRYELLPYHPLGIEKGRALGKECARFCVPDREKMEELNKYAFVR